MNEMKTKFFLMAFALLLTMQMFASKKNDKKFSFAFFTDIHLNKNHLEKNHGGFQGIEKAIADAKKQKVDFIMTGGDNVDIDAIKTEDAQIAHTLYSKYARIIHNAGVDYYAAIGNHDRFWGCPNDDQLYNDGLFEKYVNKSYYSFDHKGWHFIVLNTANSVVDEEQKQWLSSDLENIDAKTPIVIATHVPFLSVYYPALDGKYTSADTFSNFKEIWDMFDGKNLKLVLQGTCIYTKKLK
ncbi:hypothetical protein D1614_02635 [Maribellus luteus]|uniref:Calcineurin-like phosphoesterase domain-containing protein n=2 Tax=Maribellus luteus TaxID=2305463 RepID=A0A399T3C1_9BACT|nr:hypothetical protein D1614_02635 [Maribellus luteus]